MLKKTRFNIMYIVQGFSWVHM